MLQLRTSDRGGRQRYSFMLAIRSIISKLTRGNAPDAVKMNKRVSEMLKDALMSEAVEEVTKIRCCCR